MDLILPIALGAALAGFVQGLSGFGFGLTAMAIWAWMLEPRLAAALAVFGAMTGQVVAAFTVRRGWNWRRLAPFLAGGMAGLPLGLWLLPRLGVPMFQALLGALLVVLCPFSELQFRQVVLGILFGCGIALLAASLPTLLLRAQAP